MPDGRGEEATPAPPDTFAPVANAYLRFAWEANVARADEVIACGFDPEELEPRSWSSLKDVGQGLERIRDRSLPLLPSFELTDAIADLVDTGSVRDTREYRNAVVHRARPLYRETPPYGRETLWTQGRFSITYRNEEKMPGGERRCPGDRRASRNGW